MLPAAAADHSVGSLRKYRKAGGKATGVKMAVFSPWKMTNPTALRRRGTFWLHALVLKSKPERDKSRSLPQNTPTKELVKARERKDDSRVNSVVVSTAVGPGVKKPTKPNPMQPNQNKAPLYFL